MIKLQKKQENYNVHC